jgi:cytosine permease
MASNERVEHSTLEHLEEEADHLLGAEYEHSPVPLKARRSLFSNTMVWIGFPMIITGAMTGSILVLGMGFASALKAMIIGNCWGCSAPRAA